MLIAKGDGLTVVVPEQEIKIYLSSSAENPANQQLCNKEVYLGVLLDPLEEIATDWDRSNNVMWQSFRFECRQIEGEVCRGSKF